MAKRVSRTIATCGENCLGMIDPHYSGNIEPVSSAPAGVEWGGDELVGGATSLLAYHMNRRRESVRTSPPARGPLKRTARENLYASMFGRVGAQTLTVPSARSAATPRADNNRAVSLEPE